MNAIEVTVTRTLPRTRQGWIRKQSRDALIRQARREYPEHADHAVIEVRYDYPTPNDHRVIFRTTEPASLGF